MAWSSPRTWTTGETVTAAHMNQEIRDNLDALFPSELDTQDWEPPLEATVDDPSVSVNGRQYQIAGLRFLWARYAFSAVATPFGDGIYFVTVPEAAVGITSSTTAGAGQAVGSWQGRDGSVPQQSSGEVLMRSSVTIHFNTTGTGLVDNDAPWVWGSGDNLSFFATIPID